MYSVTRLLDVDAAHVDRMLGTAREAAAATGAQRWIVERTDPGSRNGGDVLARLRFADELQGPSGAALFDDALRDPAVTRVNGAGFTGEPVGAGGSGTVYRALLLRVRPDTEPATIGRFEVELRKLTGYVHTIRAWQLSLVSDAVGDTSWTHVFEQEFTDAAGLMGPYLMHPMHWAVVDRWFDPETTEAIVTDRVCHSFCAIDEPVLS